MRQSLWLVDKVRDRITLFTYSVSVCVCSVHHDGLLIFHSSPSPGASLESKSALRSLRDNPIHTVSNSEENCQIQHVASYDTTETVLEEDDDRKECPICMESFGITDVVSWSPSVDCKHVFHHECIKEGLIHHDNCPYCRVIFLPVDSNGEQSSAETNSSDSVPARPIVEYARVKGTSSPTI